MYWLIRPLHIPWYGNFLENWDSRKCLRTIPIVEFQDGVGPIDGWVDNIALSLMNVYECSFRGFRGIRIGRSWIRRSGISSSFGVEPINFSIEGYK